MGQVQMTRAMLHRPPKLVNSIISAVTKILQLVHFSIRHAASKDHKNSNKEFDYKHDLKSKKTIFVGINGLLSLINIIKTESNNFTLQSHVTMDPKLT